MGLLPSHSGRGIRYKGFSTIDSRIEDEWTNLAEINRPGKKSTSIVWVIATEASNWEDAFDDDDDAEDDDGDGDDADNDNTDDDDTDDDVDDDDDMYEPSWAVVQISLWLRAPAPTFVKADTCIFIEMWLLKYFLNFSSIYHSFNFSMHCTFVHLTQIDVFLIIFSGLNSLVP